MGALAKHTVANREFFAPGSAPTRSQWYKWVESDIVRGKIVENEVYVDLNWFAANHIMQGTTEDKLTGMDLLL